MRRLVALLAVTAAAVAGCGLPSDSVHELDPKTVPFGLLATGPTTAPPQGQGPKTFVFFVKGDRVATVSRRVVGDNVPAEALRSMLLGPTPQEAAGGLTSDVPTQTRLVSLDLSGAVATVDLSHEFGTVGGSEQVLAVAQIVYTLTTSPYINDVRFSIEGEPIEVPDGSGSLASTPRSRSDYQLLAPH